MKLIRVFQKLAFVLLLAALAAAASPRAASCAEGHYEVSLNSLVFVDTEIQKVLEIFSKMTKSNLFLDESVPRKKITFFAQNMPVRLALEMFIRTNGLMLKKMNANTFLIFPKTKAAEYESEVASHVFILENDDPKKVINILKTIGKNTKVSLNDRINGIVMIDTPENIETAKKIVARMDYRKPQVTVDLKLVEVQRDKLRDLGVQFKDTAHMIVDMRSLARLKDQVVIDTLIKENAAEVLAQPQLKVSDQQKAEIQVGDKIPIEITSASKTAAGDSVQLNKTVQWESVGIKLQIQVEKIHNENEVTLKIYNEVSSVVEYTKEGYPHIRTRNAVTVVRLNSNETAVIGGLINSEERTTVFKIPILSKLPGLGKIFRNVKTDKITTEIVMFITPVISSGAPGESEEHPQNHADLLEKAESRSAEVSSLNLGVIDRNTDYFSESLPKIPPAAAENEINAPALMAVHTPETLETLIGELKNTVQEIKSAETAPVKPAAPETSTIYHAPLKTTETTETAIQTPDPLPITEDRSTQAVSIAPPDTVEINFAAPATAAVMLQAAPAPERFFSSSTSETETSGRSDYNERLKQILNRIRSSRSYGPLQTAPAALENLK
jgi:type II secretory pathway component GspD/PulD (secretin)